ncbi:major facilitator superfamily domain-containing protein [Xylariales sp. PMI_506]|nr:major facilitator superfamily domain-containing protein [Xylariales sp. PMI_506]
MVNRVALQRLWASTEMIRAVSFLCAVVSAAASGSISGFSLYGARLITDLGYTQSMVNVVATGATMAIYISFPLWGLYQPTSPRLLSLISAVLFPAGYLAAAYLYSEPVGSGDSPPPTASWYAMVLAFVSIGAATSCSMMGCLTICARNFEHSKRMKAIGLAGPASAYGISGIIQSQLATHVFSAPQTPGGPNELDVAKYFLFSAILLFATGLLGFLCFVVIEEPENHPGVSTSTGLGTDEQRLLAGSTQSPSAYGTCPPDPASDQDETLLNDDSHHDITASTGGSDLFAPLKNPSVWWLAVGYLLVSGPHDVYMMNLGTILRAIGGSTASDHPAPYQSTPLHLTVMTATATVARLSSGLLCDHVASRSVARLSYAGFIFLMLLATPIVSGLGFLLLSTRLPQDSPFAGLLASACIGLGFGGTFTFMPFINHVWGAQSFAMIWGFVAISPASSVAVSGYLYTGLYEHALLGMDDQGPSSSQCIGWACYGIWSICSVLTMILAMIGLFIAWRGLRAKGLTLKDK